MPDITIQIDGAEIGEADVDESTLVSNLRETTYRRIAEQLGIPVDDVTVEVHPEP